jgi:hypothetical protein
MVIPKANIKREKKSEKLIGHREGGMDVKAGAQS